MTAFLAQCTPYSVLEVEGTLLAPVGGELLQRIETLLATGQRRIVLNLAQLTEIDAAGTGELLRAYRAAIAAGGSLKIANVSGSVRHLLDLAGVLALLSNPTPA